MPITYRATTTDALPTHDAITTWLRDHAPGINIQPFEWNNQPTTLAATAFGLPTTIDLTPRDTPDAIVLRTADSSLQIAASIAMLDALAHLANATVTSDLSDDPFDRRELHEETEHHLAVANIVAALIDTGPATRLRRDEPEPLAWEDTNARERLLTELADEGMIKRDDTAYFITETRHLDLCTDENQ
jgi:hypothetical protein